MSKVTGNEVNRRRFKSEKTGLYWMCCTLGRIVDVNIYGEREIIVSGTVCVGTSRR